MTKLQKESKALLETKKLLNDDQITTDRDLYTDGYRIALQKKGDDFETVW